MTDPSDKQYMSQKWVTTRLYELANEQGAIERDSLNAETRREARSRREALRVTLHASDRIIELGEDLQKVREHYVRVEAVANERIEELSAELVVPVPVAQLAYSSATKDERIAELEAELVTETGRRRRDVAEGDRVIEIRDRRIAELEAEIKERDEQSIYNAKSALSNR